MRDIIYATGNKAKYQQAIQVCQPAGVVLIQEGLNVPELQSDDATVIARDKAAKAFDRFQQPVVVTDDSWIIPGLGGFPGPYMKYVNDWFTVDDWLNLTRPLTDRRIILRQVIAYSDGQQEKVFECDLEGILLTEARGESAYPHTHIISFDGGKQTNAEYHARHESATAHLRNVWHEFVDWYGTVSD